MPQSPEEQPITGLCIVSNPSQCPMGYELLQKSYDKQEDCDLWKDSFFRQKVTRYLCITRIFPLDGGRLNNVLADIVINNERDPPPTGFSLIDFTVDSRERATRKWQINVRMLPRETTNDAICDLILLSRSKRPPIGYTLVGEVNGLLICYKMGQVPLETRSPSHINRTPNSSSSGQIGSTFDFAEWAQSLRQSYPLDPRTSEAQAWFQSHQVQSSPQHCPVLAQSSSPTGSNQYGLAPKTDLPASPQPQPSPKHLNRQDSLLPPGAALESVPFSLNPKFQDFQGLSLNNVPEVQYRSLVDIESEYSYNFHLEKTAAGQLAGSQ